MIDLIRSNTFPPLKHNIWIYRKIENAEEELCENDRMPRKMRTALGASFLWLFAWSTSHRFMFPFFLFVWLISMWQLILEFLVKLLLKLVVSYMFKCQSHSYYDRDLNFWDQLQTTKLSMRTHLGHKIWSPALSSIR